MLVGIAGIEADLKDANLGGARLNEADLSVFRHGLLPANYAPGPCGRILVRGEPGWDIISELAPAQESPSSTSQAKGHFLPRTLICYCAKVRRVWFANGTAYCGKANRTEAKI